MEAGMGERARELLAADESQFRIAIWNALSKAGINQDLCFPIINGAVEELGKLARPAPQPDTDLVEKVIQDAETLANERGGDFGDLTHDELAGLMSRISCASLSTLPRTYGDGIEDAAVCAEKLGRMLPEGGPVDAKGWPTTPEGAARHQSFAIAAAIRTLSPSGIEDVREAGEIERLRQCAKDNNTLARMNGQHRDQWREKAVICMEALDAIDSLPVLEINPSNYDHEDVCELNSNAVQAALIARAALAQVRGEQS
jgi:hypothetical protein